MALTTAQRITQIQDVLDASGGGQIRYADGSSVTYDRVGLERRLAELRATLASELATPRLRRLVIGVTSGLQ